MIMMGKCIHPDNPLDELIEENPVTKVKLVTIRVSRKNELLALRVEVLVYSNTMMQKLLIIRLVSS